MSSTVTTTTVTTITSVTSVAGAALMASLALGLVLALLFLLIQREVLISPSSQRQMVWRKALDIAIAPLVIGFMVIALVRVGEILLR